jgi:hypothetical protein
MAYQPLHIVAANNTNPIQIGNGNAILGGIEIYNTAAAARFVKFYWGAPGSFSSGGQKPTVGTDIPNITIGQAATSGSPRTWTDEGGVYGKGSLFVAFTVNAADSDNTAVTAGDVILTVFYR